MKKFALFVCFSATLAGCGYDSSNSASDTIRTGPSSTGVSAYVWGNLPNESSEAQVAASVFYEADKKALVGGDIIRAYSESSAATLRAFENLSGDYAASIDVLNPAQGIRFAVEHDPEVAREDRWYPVDELLVDPGPGNLVGYSAQLEFPAPLIVSSPTNFTEYRTRSDTITLVWEPDSSANQIRLTALSRCETIGYDVDWGFERLIATNQDADWDSGTYSLPVSDILAGTSLNNAVGLFGNLALIIASLPIQLFSFTLFDTFLPVSLSDSSIERCDLYLTLFREVPGTLGPDVSGGYAIASTSQTIHITYDPL